MDELKITLLKISPYVLSLVAIITKYILGKKSKNHSGRSGFELDIKIKFRK